MKDIYRFISQRIKQERHKLELTQEELAGRSGVTSKFLSDIERAVKKPSIETISKIANGLEIHLWQLLYTEVLYSNPPEEFYVKKLKSLLKGHSPAEIKKAIDMVKLLLKSSAKKKKSKGEPFLIG